MMWDFLPEFVAGTYPDTIAQNGIVLGVIYHMLPIIMLPRGQ